MSAVQKPLLPTIHEDSITIENDTYNEPKEKIDDNANAFGSKKKQAMLFAIMLFVNVLGPLSTEAQVPALGSIAEDLNTSSRWVQLTITIYMLFFGLSQLFFGTLSDIYGRRNTLLAGLVIYTLTSLGCALAPNIIALNIFRAVQATGSGAGMVIVYAIARDVFRQDARTRVLGILGGLRPIVIAASPVFGGAISTYLGWRYIFYIIGGLSLFILIVVFFVLPETRDQNTVQIARLQDYKDTVRLLIKNRVFVGLVLISGGVYAGVFIMFNEFSFVMEDRFGYSELTTGLLCGLIVFGLMVGSIISIIFVKCVNPITVVFCGVIQLVACCVLFILPLIIYSGTAPDFVGLNVYWVLVPLFLFVCADGLMLPHLISTALEPFKRQAGTASALAGFWRFFSAAVIALIVSSSSEQHLMVLHIGVGAMAISAIIIYAFTLYGVNYEEFLAESKRADLLMEDSATSTDGVTVISDDDEYNSMKLNVTEQTPLIKKVMTNNNE